MTSTRIPLEGAYNFRDLGGLPAPGGRSTVPGRVFRSDRLSRLTAADLERLEALGIGRVYDLRSELELAEDGAGEFSSASDRHRHRPLVRVSLSLKDPRIDWTKVDLPNRYPEMLDEGAPVIREVLEHLASDDATPTVFHCTGGKDRTGVLAAVLLRALGVDDDTIVADYAVSEVHLAPFVDASRDMMREAGVDPAIVLYLCGSPAERMVRMLESMDERWGSVEDYLHWTGADTSRLVDALRRRLLD